MSWLVINEGEFVDVVPIHDAKEHFSGDECWCAPTTERHPLAVPLIAHNESGRSKESSSWRDVSYATNLFMLRNAFKWRQDGYWYRQDEDKAAPFLINQQSAEFFVGAMLDQQGSMRRGDA